MKKQDDYKGLAAALVKKTGAEVRFDAGSRALYATDSSNYRQVPIGVVVPKSKEDILQTVALCREFDAPIVNRGGGTSLAGQGCNTAVLIDMSKYCNRLLDLNAEEKYARVEPGLILDQLRGAAEKHHLTYGPDPSTHNHCTLGGMLGNNSCGTHSVMAGETVHNVIEMEIVTYDGAHLVVKETSEPEIRKIIREGGRAGEIYSALLALQKNHAETIRKRFPKIPRRVSGYNLPWLLPEQFDVARALVGSESTCVTILSAKVRLVPWPAARTLVVVGFENIYDAADHVTEVMKSGPIALEGIDRSLVEDIKKKHLHPENLKLLPDGNGWLLVEYGGDNKAESDEKARRLMRSVARWKSVQTKLYDNEEEEKHIWKIRESGLGATARIPGKPDTWEGWEDSAVPPEKLGNYLREIRKLYDEYGYDGSFYGHFGQGCLHTRINFDLVTRDGIKKFRSFIEAAADLVVSFGGSFSGEHGDGQSRAELLPKMFGSDGIRAFEEFKAIWDPANRMNPGKIVRPYRIDENLRLGSSYAPPSWETHFKFPEDQGSFAKAAERCVGVGECRKMGGGTMCPSFMATREEKDSTRGRARLLFEMLRGEVLRGGWRDEAVKDSLDLCLACKGCKGECPLNVDMATYKAEFLSHYYAGRLRPLSAYSMGMIFWWARLASLAPRLVNWITHAPVLQRLVKAAGGIAPQRKMPLFARETFTSWFRKRIGCGSGRAVLLWPDTFNNHFYPETLKAATELLEGLGFRVMIPKTALCCGRPLYDYGMLVTAKKLLRKILTELRDEIRSDTPLVALEPSCLSVFRDEMLGLFPTDEDAKRLKKNSLTLAEFLNRNKISFENLSPGRKAVLHGHCHHKALLKFEEEQKLLSSAGLEVTVPDPGCCGMAGAFGFEKDHYGISVKIGERSLLPAVRTAPGEALIIADGFSCRQQISQLSDKEALHLAEALLMLMREKELLLFSKDDAGAGHAEGKDGGAEIREDEYGVVDSHRIHTE